MTEKTDSERIAELERKMEVMRETINQLHGVTAAYGLAFLAFAQTSAYAPRIATLLRASVERTLEDADDYPFPQAYTEALTYEAASILGALEQTAPPDRPGPSGPTGN